MRQRCSRQLPHEPQRGHSSPTAGHFWNAKCCYEVIGIREAREDFGANVKLVHKLSYDVCTWGHTRIVIQENWTLAQWSMPAESTHLAGCWGVSSSKRAHYLFGDGHVCGWMTSLGGCYVCTVVHGVLCGLRTYVWSEGRNQERQERNERNLLPCWMNTVHILYVCVRRICSECMPGVILVRWDHKFRTNKWKTHIPCLYCILEGKPWWRRVNEIMNRYVQSVCICSCLWRCRIKENTK